MLANNNVHCLDVGWDMLGTKWQYGEREPQDWTVNDTPANTVHPYYTFGEKAYAWRSGTQLHFSMDCYESKLRLTWDDVSYSMDLPDVTECPPCPFLFFYGTELTAIISRREVTEKEDRDVASKDEATKNESKNESKDTVSMGESGDKSSESTNESKCESKE